MTATALVRTRPFDERYAYLPTQQARDLLLSMPHPGDEWPPAAHRALGALFAMATAALPGAELASSEPASVRQTMRANMEHRIAVGDAAKDKRLDIRVAEIVRSRAQNPDWAREKLGSAEIR